MTDSPVHSSSTQNAALNANTPSDKDDKNQDDDVESARPKDESMEETEIKDESMEETEVSTSEEQSLEEGKNEDVDALAEEEDNEDDDALAEDEETEEDDDDALAKDEETEDDDDALAEEEEPENQDDVESDRVTMGTPPVYVLSLPQSCTGCSTTQNLSRSIPDDANIKRYCTNCILKNNRGLFCPICFHVYEDSPPLDLCLMCLRCPSIAHQSCALPFTATDSAATAEPIFVCPACADPNFSYFNPTGSLDQKSSKVLLAASQIAAASAHKALAVAQSVAERRVKEAAVARKKAREALENLTAKEKEHKENSNNTK